MVQKQQLTVRLGKLKEILNDAKAILEWHKLKAFEAKRNTSSKILFHDDTLGQLTDKQAAFQTLWIQINILLQDKNLNLSKSEKNKFQKELNKISMQFYYLGSGIRFY
jgi:hypothetical protein